MPFSGEEVVKALRKHRFEIVGRTGSHVKLQFINKHTNEVRKVTVPLHEELDPGTLHSIADQVGARDFQKFKEWIEESL